MGPHLQAVPLATDVQDEAQSESDRFVLRNGNNPRMMSTAPGGDDHAAYEEALACRSLPLHVLVRLLRRSFEDGTSTPGVVSLILFIHAPDVSRCVLFNREIQA
jgi:hypothetical protein